ncbi:F-box/LRR-repeat protein 7-like [Periplaneta americana]|uniref:F-box/LRR-repeat protein 7-like n=1 Tax=Periplaneta americana TaxID=6978 RepID=UPI0037E8FFA1
MKRAKYQRTAVYTDRCLRSRTSSCHISRLPNEMITLIFSYLDVLELRASVAPVCKRWYELAHSPVLLRKLRFEGSRVATDTAKHLLEKAPLLRELTLVKRGDVDELLSQLCKTNRRVETLTIKQYSQESDSCRWLLLRAPLLNRLLRCCPCIRHLDLSEFNIRSGKFFHDLGRLLPNLTSLQLSHGRFLTPANVRDVAVHCSRLERLWLSGVNHCDNRDAWKDTYTTLFTLHWSTLTHLKFDAHKLTDYEFKGLSKCVNLRKLHLLNAKHLDKQGLQAIGSLCRLLSLRLHNVRHLCCVSLAELFRKGNMRGLVDLSLAGCTCVDDACAEVIARNCRQLHSLSLALVDDMTDSGVIAILRSCDNLYNLDLYHMRSLNGAAFASIALFARKLRFLVLEHPCDRSKEERIGTLPSSVQVHRSPSADNTNICAGCC